MASKCDSQLATFYRFWALKESFVKAEGSGLSWNLQRLRFKPLSTLSASSGGSAVASDTRFFVDGEAACRRRWRFHERLLTASDGTEYCASIALGDCDDDGDELDVREIVDVGKDLGRIV